ncbi:hypothetical protein DPMN_147927 [Dreissena polymorpha]|uniref:Uncharacterized protein n=1 Tax=Dreissena polymorpha TaxID=45954 RepID=A0A9D4F8M2_DREPO|nr:hypothetical protein DPMN_147927 [Dreissena polymorpha]
MSPMIPQGEPFMESLIYNRPMLYSISISGGAIIALASGLLPEANEYFERVQLPTKVSRTGAITYREVSRTGAITYRELVQLPTEVSRTGAITYRELVQLPTEATDIVGAFVIDRTLQLLCGTGKVRRR